MGLLDLFCVLCSIDLFIDWGTPSRLTSVILLIGLWKPNYQLFLELPHTLWGHICFHVNSVMF